MDIKAVTLFQCPISGKTFKTKKGAEAHAAKLLLEKEELAKKAELAKISEEQKNIRRDFVRVNLSHVPDLAKMINEKAKEFWNIDADLKISVNFSHHVSNSHDAPIGERTNWSGRDKTRPTYYPGWSGRIRGKVIVPKHLLGNNSTASASDVLFGWGGFRGFHTSSGCPGDAKGEYEMDIGFYFFLKDFPLLEAQYEEHKVNQEIHRSYIESVQEFDSEKDYYRETHSQVLALQEQINSLNEKLCTAYYVANAEFDLANPKPVVKYSSNLQELEKNFGALNRLEY